MAPPFRRGSSLSRANPRASAQKLRRSMSSSPARGRKSDKLEAILNRKPVIAMKEESKEAPKTSAGLRRVYSYSAALTSMNKILLANSSGL